MVDAVDISRVRRAGAIGNFVEYFDNALYGLFAVTISKLFFPNFDPVVGLLSTFALFAVSFLVRPLGALVFGYMGDRWGRKKVLIWSIGMMSLATSLVGVLPVYSVIGVLAPVLLLVCRLLQGFSAGGEATTAFVLVAEHSPVGSRARNVSPLVATTIVAIVVPSLIGLVINLYLTPGVVSSWGWRLPFLLAVPLGVVGLLLRLRIDDSLVYKKAAAISSVIRRTGRGPLVEAFRKTKKEMLVLFAWIALQGTTGYILTSYIDTQLTHFEHHTEAEAFGIIGVALCIATAAIFPLGRIADRVSRKKFAVVHAVVLIIWSYPTFVLIGYGSVVATIALAIFAIFKFGTMLSAGLMVVELFPVDVRAAASSLPYAVGFAVFGGTAPIVATWLASTVSPTAPAYYIVALSIVGLIVAWFGIPNAREMAVVVSDEGLTAVQVGEADAEPAADHDTTLNR